ncbi:uncharacterized protein LOC111904824 [Lactuca sativa]|uniref:uncharacterized protein LOC111904824 n=1 Tax=Lactuca sativa TaxID=4236 RepID=UPI000CBD9780|nr:uncharacterized protein LOC111904824 [Lactuca sativa]
MTLVSLGRNLLHQFGHSAGICRVHHLFFQKGFFKKLRFLFIMGFLESVSKAFSPPPPKICGSPDGPPITSPRIKLHDGRHLSYKEHGVSKDSAKYKIIFIHGYNSCKEYNPLAITTSPDLIESLRVYIVSFDRPGYGESDPNPNRTLKSFASDVEELADQLGLGSKFYLVGFSMGGQLVWPCLKYIPQRLEGAALVSPGINNWWPSFPSNLSNEVYNKMMKRDQWARRVTHYLPLLTYWWNTQTLFPRPSLFSRVGEMFSPQDMEVLSKLSDLQMQTTPQGEFESLHRDLIIAYGKWEFDPMELEDPFPNIEGSVQIWMGDNDDFVPVALQRYIAQKLPWIKYHEIPGAGHMFFLADGMSDTILKTLLNVKD